MNYDEDKREAEEGERYADVGKRERGLYNTTQAAHFLGMSASFLAKARLAGDGPIYRKIGHAVRYARKDLEDFAKGSARRSSSARSAA